MAKIINFVGPVHMGRQHKGLHEEAERAGIDLNTLPRGHFVIFVASHTRRYKAYGNNRVFIDQDLSPLTLEEYLANNAETLDVGLDEYISVKLTPKHRTALSKFFLEFKKRKANK